MSFELEEYPRQSEVGLDNGGVLDFTQLKKQKILSLSNIVCVLGIFSTVIVCATFSVYIYASVISNKSRNNGALNATQVCTESPTPTPILEPSQSPNPTPSSPPLPSQSPSPSPSPEDTPTKSIIFMLSDGCGPASITFAREIYGEPLFQDNYIGGTIRTRSYNSVVTDSAAGATAYSCGLKTNNHYIAVKPDGRPCGTILEAAQAAGKKTGLVVTSRITHATPACFNSHALNREDEDFIAIQQVNSKVDIMLGGGNDHFNASTRPDGVDLIAQAEDNGYRFINDASILREGNLADSAEKILGTFAPSHIPFDIDRKTLPGVPPTQIPSLAEMTKAALDFLDAKSGEEGFFMLVEGSRIDHAAHGNDPVGHYSEIRAYNEAMKVVANYINEHPDTIAIGVSDHETGGLGLGHDGHYYWFPEVIRNAKASVERMQDEVRNTGKTAPQVFNELSGLDRLSSSEEMDAQYSGFASVYSARAGVAWTTGGHTGVDINYYVIGKERTNLLGRNMENTEMGKWMSDYLGLTEQMQTISQDLQDQSVSPTSRSPQRNPSEYGH
eukprot:TRINITY_DN3259_c0_g1_i1.p1 TRINITY_DN3259_c0_g1~~TRINITY_DN3259_c0_g1_i1.p1  ORF type:complete len:556 (-),score=66.47 TRINITY_DN3259_c0_g1_i1:198-1865(-)